MTRPTVFGANGNSLLAGGEAGAEAVLPLSKLFNEMDRMFNKQTQTLAKQGNNNRPITVQVTLDGKVIAQSTIKEFKNMNNLGTLDTSWL